MHITLNELKEELERARPRSFCVQVQTNFQTPLPVRAVFDFHEIRVRSLYPSIVLLSGSSCSLELTQVKAVNKYIGPSGLPERFKIVCKSQSETDISVIITISNKSLLTMSEEGDNIESI